MKLFPALGPRMGRRRRDEVASVDKKKSPLVKIDPELVEKIQWIVRFRNKVRKPGEKEWAAADIVEPLIRSVVERDYKVIEPEVANIMRDEERAAKRLQDHDAKAKGSTGQ